MKITPRKFVVGQRVVRKTATAAEVLARIAESRARERAELLKMRLQLDKLRMETLRGILASRAKFNAARWKIIHKAMDD